MFRFCLRLISRPFVKLLTIGFCIQTLVMISLIYTRTEPLGENRSQICIEYRLMEGKHLVFSQRYKKYASDVQFPSLKDLVIIDSNHIGINPKKIGIQYPNPKSDFLKRMTYHFQPILTPEERELSLFTFQMFINLCRRYKLTYLLVYGSLLGSYRHHGMVPWDDDIDVLMNETEKRNVVLTFGNIPGFGLSYVNDFQWKFYPKFYKTLLHFHHRWPFIDIFFFAENNTHIWDSTTANGRTSHRTSFRKDEVFPLVARPFEGLLLLAPCGVVTIVKRTFPKHEWCESNSYWHKLEQFAPSWRPKNINCYFLYPLHPFVFRVSAANKSMVTEILKINGRTISTYEFRNQCEKS